MNSEVRASSSAYSTDSLKREREGDSCELEIYPSPKRYADWHIFVPEILPALSGDESVHSMQAWETEFCQDTPDTCSDSSSDRDLRELLGIEYDVASLSDVPLGNPFGTGFTSDSSTENADQTRVTEIVVEVEKEEAIERECWGDQSDSSSTSSSDQEISQSDFWTCTQCKFINKPIPRVCIKCFQVRKNWFPPRPQHKLKKKNKRQRIKLNRFDRNHSKDVGEKSSSSFVSDNKESGECSMTIASDSKSSDLVSEQSRKSIDTEGTDIVSALKDKCIACMEGPKNALFVHGTIGHLCCCYSCAKRVYRSSGKCPVCNRKTNCVVKIFVA